MTLGGASDTLFDADEPIVVTGAGLPPERGKGPGTVSSVKTTPLAEYPRKGRATGGVRVQRLLSGEAVLVLGWAGALPNRPHRILVAGTAGPGHPMAGPQPPTITLWAHD